MAEAIGDLVKNNIAEKIRKTAYVNSLKIAKTNRDIKREIHIVRKKTPNCQIIHEAYELRLLEQKILTLEDLRRKVFSKNVFPLS